MTLATTSLTHACSKCGDEKSWQDFQLYKGHPVGQCRACKTASAKAKRKADGVPVKSLSRVEGDKKLCLGCEEMVPLTEFAPNPRGLLGVSSYCRECFSAKFSASKEEACEATKRYRKLNRERYLANHRVRMFEYRTKKKVSSDGSVTDEFLKALYGETNCAYCGKETPESERTADHKIPLNKEGPHTAGNLTMACFGCNSAKRDMTDVEFRERMSR